MAPPSKSWVVIADSQVDADSPLDSVLMTGIRDDLVHLEEWLGFSYTAAQDHDHDGTNSKSVDALTAVAFSVHKNGTNQTGVVTATWTKVTWETELFDENNDFDIATNERFTPTIAGKYVLIGVAGVIAHADQGLLTLSIYKNGTLLKQSGGRTSGTGSQRASVSAIVDANG